MFRRTVTQTLPHRFGLPLQHARLYSHSDAIYRVHKVRFVRPWFTARFGQLLPSYGRRTDCSSSRLTTALAYGATTYLFCRYGLGLRLEIEEVKDEETETRPVDEASTPNRKDETTEATRFIPLTWPSQGPLVYYKGPDPEWQSFCSFSRDKEGSQLVKRVFSRNSLEKPA